MEALKPAASVAPETASAPPPRLVSLDAFRGFTMFWLMGGKAFVLAIATLLGWEVVRGQLQHSDWVGLRYYDLIWPSFMLMVGVAVPFAYARRRTRQTRGEFLRDAWRRALILFLLGSLRASLSEGAPRWVELSSALQPIALAYLVAAHLVDRPWRTSAAVAGGILVAYALVLAFVPAGGASAGSYIRNHNVVTAVDQWVIGRAHPEGWGTVLSAVPTIAHTLVGLLLGQMLLTATMTNVRKMRWIALSGAGCVLAGLLLSPVVPVIMKLWTTSYALVSIGAACLLFAGFYWVIDVRGWRGWTLPLVVIGVNALAAYLMPTLLSVSKIAGTFTKPLAPQLGTFGPLVSTGAVLLLGWLILYWLYRRKIYLTP